MGELLCIRLQLLSIKF